MESQRKIKSPTRVHYLLRPKPFNLDAMKTPEMVFLLALCLTLFESCSQKERDRFVLANTLAASEENAVKVGLAKMGIGEGYEITVADQCADVENTAAQEMQQFLARGSLSARIVPESQTTAGKRIILGRASNLGTIRNLENKGAVTIGSVAAKDDGFGDGIILRSWTGVVSIRSWEALPRGKPALRARKAAKGALRTCVYL
jgi:hypothetical protein